MRNMKWLSLAMASLPLFAIAQKAPKTPDPKPYASSITADDLKRHLYIVASKEMEGRETATEGQRKAAAYIENHFKSLGLEPGNKGSYQMPYPVSQDSFVRAGMKVNDQVLEYGKDFAVNSSSNYNATQLFSELVFAGYGIVDSTRDDYGNVDVKGKLVMLVTGGPNSRNVNPFQKQAYALQKGAAAVLIIYGNVQGSRPGAKGQMSMNSGYARRIMPNVFNISEAVAKSVLGSSFDSAKNGNLPARVFPANVYLQMQKESINIQSSNVIGFLEGTDLKDQFLVLSAHYDHLGKRDTTIYYGADDDGSGTVSILELAEAFAKAKKEGKGPRRSIIFMTVSGEEKGLWGSRYYSDNPAYPLDKTTADLNIDMVGRIDPKRKVGDSMNYVYVVGDDKLSSDLRPISEMINKKYTKLELDYKYNDPKDPERIYFRSDHYNFARMGVPIIFYFNGTHNDYHRPTDTPDKINYTLMAKRAQFVFYTAWEMANRNDMLKRDIPLNPPQRGF
jgi:peptidase M28-like protein